MTTKEQERQAIEKIRKIVKELGENSYVGFAMEGVLELAEDNIREDTAYSMKKNAEIAWERADKAEKESKLLNAELGTAKKITEENNKAIAKLKADIYKLKANEVPEELIKEMYNMAYDKEAEMIEKMEETADQMADASIAGEDVQKFAEDYKAQKEKRNRYAKMMDTLDAREFGLPQARERVFTISVLGGEKFQFDELIRTPMRSIDEFLEKNEEVPEVYDVTQPSVREVIGVTGSVRRATVIEDYAFTITTRQDRTPAQVIDCGKGRYRYLTELECWRLQGYTDEDFERAKKAQQKKGRYYTALYKQAGNSIAVPIFESIFRKIILNEVREKEEQR